MEYHKIFLTGATGFVGRCLSRELVENNFEVRCLVRSGSEHKVINRDAVEVATGDVLERESLYAGMKDCDVVINLVGIIREDKKRNITFQNLHCLATKNCVDVAAELGIRRFLQMSALGTRENTASRYHQTKYWAEEYLRESNLLYTIFRPTIIFGAEDKSINYFAEMMKKLPFFPVFGDGNYRLAPVSVKTVAEAFTQSINNPETHHQTFEIQGPETYTYNELLETIAEKVNRKPRLLHLPVPVARFIIGLIQNFRFAPLTLEQLNMLLEGSTTEDNRIYKILNLEQRRLSTHR
jgi:NADH dehydrogenase